MAIFVVMDPPADAAEREPAFVRDGFHFVAFVVPVIWLVWHRLWIEALAALLASVAISAIASRMGVGPAAPALTLLVSIYFGLEGAALRIAALRRRGWREAAVIYAESLDDAEARHAVEFGEPDSVQGRPEARLPASRPVGHEAPALGLFGYPGVR
jgi:hypothetical protein